MAIAAGKLRHKWTNPLRQNHEVTDSLLRQELAEREELVGANAHGARAVSLGIEVSEEIVDRFSQPGAVDARTGFRAG
jgi:hypothetical protein